VVKRWLNEELQRDSVLNAPAAVRDCLRIHFAGREYELFVALFLDAQHRLIIVDELFRGTLTQTSVYPREIVKAALRVNAAAVIFAHNHPSGVTDPSTSDKLLTAALKSALSLVDVSVLDHFVVAGADVCSFAERGLL
jgi:DNA repair protein RadC